MIGPRLELRRSQQLVMTPQLRQAIKLLRMSNLELERFLDAEIERNPLLDRAPAESGAPAPPAPPSETPAQAEAALREGDPGAVAGAFESGADNLYDAGDPPPPARTAGGPGGGGAGGGAGAGDGDLPSLEATLADTPGLIDHVAAQIRLTRAPAAARGAAMALAADIDEAGYLRLEAPEDAARRLGVDPATLEAAIALLHQCEPAGLGARSLAECLALQLAERDRLDPAMRALLDNLPLLARADFRALTRLCGVDEADIRDMAAEIRRLDPRPGRAFSAPPALAAPPDVFVRRAPGGGWTVELNTETLPRLLVDNAYAARLAAGGAEARGFVSECRRSAGWLARSLEQRARTILKVATEIARRQEAFLDQGVSALRPMTLRQVADEIGVHESTVSRVAAGKRLACARGTFELRWFFTQALAATDGGEAHSATAIRDRIRALIDGENPRRPLSDDRLTATLRADGVDIARRTVAKYREGMNIPSSVQRRRLKAAAASS